MTVLAVKVAIRPLIVAARTGRSAKTMEVPAIPFRVRVVPSRVAPAAFMTISEGTTSGRAWPIVLCSGSWGGGTTK